MSMSFVIPVHQKHVDGKNKVAIAALRSEITRCFKISSNNSQLTRNEMKEVIIVIAK